MAVHYETGTSIDLLSILTNSLHHVIMYLYFFGVPELRPVMIVTGTFQLIATLGMYVCMYVCVWCVVCCVLCAG